METMKLQAGKSYYRRDGGVESIVQVDELTGLAFNAAGMSWFSDGCHSIYFISQADLISEVPSADQAFSETAEAGLSVVRESDSEAITVEFESRDPLLIALCQREFGVTPTFKSHEQ